MKRQVVDGEGVNMLYNRLRKKYNLLSNSYQYDHKNTEIVRHTIYMRYKLLKVLFRVLECSLS